jgi:site-specific recombinase XerD
MTKEFKQNIINELSKREYKKTTVNQYSSQLFKLFEYYPGIEPINISKGQVLKYGQSLIAMRRSQSSIQILTYACNFFFDELNNKKHGNYNLKAKQKKEVSVEFFKQNEILNMINSKQNIKHKTIIALMYSCGLDTSEVINLKIKHFRFEGKRPEIQIYNNEGKIKRKVILSRKVLPMLKSYYTSYKPSDWFFYGATVKEKRYSAESVRKMINDTILKSHLNPLLKAKSIKLSYIKHLTQLNVPLISVLGELGIYSFDTHLIYSKKIYGNYRIEFSPIDKLINEKSQKDEFKDLESLVFQLKDSNEIDYLMEAVECFRNGSLRAGVIFIWSASIQSIRQKIINSSDLKEINSELKFIDKGAKEIKNIDSFQFVKDEKIIHLSQRIGLFDKFEKNILIENCLSLRNKCGHPSNYKPEIQKVKAFVEDIINMIYKKNIA